MSERAKFFFFVSLFFKQKVSFICSRRKKRRTEIKKKQISKTKVKCVLKSFSCFVWNTFCNGLHSKWGKNEFAQIAKADNFRGVFKTTTKCIKPINIHLQNETKKIWMANTNASHGISALRKWFWNTEKRCGILVCDTIEWKGK